MEVRLPKTFVTFKSSKASKLIEAEILGPLWSGYRDILQKKVDSLRFTIKIAPRMSKVMRVGDLWNVYLKAVVSGVPDEYTGTQIDSLLTRLEPTIDEAVAHISQRLEDRNISATEIKAIFRRKDGSEVVRSG